MTIVNFYKNIVIRNTLYFIMIYCFIEISVILFIMINIRPCLSGTNKFIRLALVILEQYFVPQFKAPKFKCIMIDDN